MSPVDARCPHCHEPISCAQYHAGFSNLGFMYCGRDGTLLTWSAYSPMYSAIFDKHPWMLDAAERQLVEGSLRPCRCGGSFRFDNPPRCPTCGESLASLVKDPIHFLDFGAKGRCGRGWTVAGAISREEMTEREPCVVRQHS